MNNINKKINNCNKELIDLNKKISNIEKHLNDALGKSEKLNNIKIEDITKELDSYMKKQKFLLKQLKTLKESEKISSGFEICNICKGPHKTPQNDKDMKKCYIIMPGLIIADGAANSSKFIRNRPPRLEELYNQSRKKKKCIIS